MEEKKLIYPALSKLLFYYRAQISKFVLEQGGVPLNPFMLFDYFLTDSVDRDMVRAANNTLVARADELWVFGSISNGVEAEIALAERLDKPIRYFIVEESRRITEIGKAAAVYEK